MLADVESKYCTKMNVEYNEYDMDWLKGMSNFFFAPLKKELNDGFQRKYDALESKYKAQNDKLAKDNETLNSKVNALTKEIATLRDTIADCNKRIQPILDSHNRENTRALNLYEEAKKTIKKLFVAFGQQFPRLASKGKIQELEDLVRYFCTPTTDNKAHIVVSNTEEVRELLSQIEDFNKVVKPGFIDFLSSCGKKWEDCVKFPISNKFNPLTMESRNDLDIDIDSPIYVVNFGYDMPKFDKNNTNLIVSSEKQRPIVCERKKSPNKNDNVDSFYSQSNSIGQQNNSFPNMNYESSSWSNNDKQYGV